MTLGIPIQRPTITADQEPIRLAIVATSLSRAAGGVLPIMQNHARELMALGLDVSVHGVTDDFTLDDLGSWGKIPVYISRSYGPKRIAFAPGLSETIAAVNPHVVHQHGIWQYPSVAVTHWRRRSRRPVVISAQGMLEPWAMNNSAIKKRAVGALYENSNIRNASAIHVCASEIAAVRQFAPNIPIAVLPNGALVNESASSSRRPCFLPEDGRRTLLFLGRLHPKKGLVETLQAWRHLKDTAPGIAAVWRLAIVGWDEGGFGHSLVRQTQLLGLTQDVVFAGPVFGAEKESTFQHADAFILASHSEGFPMAVMEAFANSLPVFMTRACNIPEGFSAKAAFEVTTDPEHLAGILARELSQPPEKLAEVGKRGAQLVKERFSWQSIASDLSDLYRYVLGITSARPSFLVLPHGNKK